ncbi:glycoside hydrolase family 15 protein [Microvirga terricola]|uniref:glucan 1,4-alpha-glucosidase n=1 Tax=Microvirga terricola TaxID=2719797 RepID=A0ABX0VF25_9HYPH|nr:glycoside hydrolase family 15 protein [Microvirga terricola]NIX77540.1 glucan 1,4-alpha-glucosidase [Microvirga terricola]
MRSAAEELARWMDAELQVAATAIFQGVSATHLVMERSSFGEKIVPKPGSIVAAPATDLSGGDPDYFFHWLRDSSLVMDALRILHMRHAWEGAHQGFRDFVRFGLDLTGLDGTWLSQETIRKGINPDFLKYVRSDEDLARATGEALLGEVRYNPDGTLDIIKWSRPQNDGPALRALCVLRYLQVGERFGEQPTVDLLMKDLAFIERCCMEPCYDLWEEELGHHYYTHLVQMAALEDGARWLIQSGDEGQGNRLLAVAQTLRRSLDLHWSPEKRFYLSRTDSPRNTRKDLDASAILAVLHANRAEGAHSVLDPKIHATVEKLENLFAREYRINDPLPHGRGPAMGRYADDHYLSGGAWYMTTLGTAEFYYRLTERIAAGCELECCEDNASFLTRVVGDGTATTQPSTREARRKFAGAFLNRGDAFMLTVKDYTPASGELSEQFDQSTGRQTSAKNLAWSYAAFITAYDARQRARSSLFLKR